MRLDTVPIEAAGKAAGLTKEQRQLLDQYVSFSRGNQVESSARIYTSIGSSFFRGYAEEKMRKKTKRDKSEDAAKGEEVSADAENGCREILRWLYKHGEIRTLASEGGQKTGKSMMPFLESIASRPISQQARIFYLVCVDHTKNCTEKDLREAVVTGPNLNDFRKKMNITKWKFWTRLTGNKMKWDMLGAAVMLVDQRYRGKAVSRVDIKAEQDRKKAAEEEKNKWEEVDVKQLVLDMSGFENIDKAEGIDQLEGIVKEQEDEDNNIDNEIVNKSESEAETIINEMSPNALESKIEKRGQDTPTGNPDIQRMKDDNRVEITKQKAEANKDGASAEEQDEEDKGKSKDEPPKEKHDYSNPAEAEKIRQIEDELDKLKDMDDSNPKKAEKVKALSEELKKILDSQKDLKSASVGTEDPLSWIIELGSYASYVATAIENVPFMETAAGLALCFDALAIASRTRYLLNTPDLSREEVVRQVADMGINAINIGKDVARIADLTVLVKAGSSVKQAGEVISEGAFNTVSNAFGIITGAATLTKGSVMMHESKKMKAGADKAKEKLSQAGTLKDDDELYANDLTSFVHSQSHCMEAKAAYNIVNGAMTTIVSAISLTGLGAILGIPLAIAQYSALGIGWLIKTIRNSREGSKVLDRFFGIDAAIDAYNQQLYESYGLMESVGMSKNAKKKLKKDRARVKMDSGVEKLFRKELLAYGEAMIGCTSDKAALNFIQTTYAEYLWNTVFLKKTSGYYTANDYDSSPYVNDISGEEPSVLDENRTVRFACKDLLEGIGTHCKFSRDGKERPETTMNEVKRRLALG